MKKTLISAILVIALCFSVIAGSTFALFTAESGINVAITSAKVAVKATIVKASLATSSLGVAQTAGEFANGGKAEFNTKDDLVLTNVTPGDKATFTIQVENTSTVDVQYRVKWAVDGELYEVLVATADGNKIVNNTSDWALWTTAEANTKTIEVSVELPYTVGNEYQEKSASVSFMVEAVQGNAIVTDIETADQFIAALGMGLENLSLVNNITLPEACTLKVAEGVTTTIDLGVYTIDAGYQAGSTTKHTYAIENYGTLILKGDGVINARGVGNYGTLIVEGGTYNAIDENGGASIWNYAGSNVTVHGGTFNTAADESAPGPTCVMIDTGATAVINGGTFTALAEETVAVINNGTLTVNGGTFTSKHSVFSNSGTMTINNATASTDDSGHVFYTYAGTTEINGGDFAITFADAPAHGTAMIYTSGTATVAVKGGNFASDYAALAYGGMKVTLYGGTYEGKAGTVYSQLSGIGIAEFVADGYTAAKNAADNSYFVVEAGNKVATNSKGEVLIVPEKVDTIIEETAGTTVQATLNSALQAGKSVYIDAPGTYDMPGVSGKEMTIAGTKDVIIDIGGGYGQTTSINGSDITFEGVTVKGSTDNYQGLSDAGTVTYNNVTLNAGTFLYGEKTVFNNCTFNLTTQYLWTYAVNEVEFNNCVFNTEGKAILVYNEGDGGSTVTVKDCTFNASKAAYTWDNQYVAAVEINSSLINAPEKFVVNFEGTNTVNFTGTEADAKGNCGFNGLWRVKNETFKANKQNLIVVDGLTIVADGLYTDAEGNFYVANGNGLAALNAYLTADMWATDKLCNKTIHIMNDIDASGVVWNTVNAHTGSHSQNGFTFDGQGYTISGLAINGSGLFNTRASNGTTSTPTTFKDITFDDVTVNGDFHTGVVWGHAYGNLVLNNVHVTNSNVTGLCNVGALVGRNGSDGAYSTIKFINCSVTDTTVTSTGGGDNAGASAFLGAALGGAGWIDLTFEGNNVATGNTLETADGQQGGGIYAITVWGEPSWDIPEVVTNYNNYKNY